MPRKEEVGCLRHPEASTIRTECLDGGRSYSWQILAPMSPHEGETPGTRHTNSDSHSVFFLHVKGAMSQPYVKHQPVRQG